MDKFLRHVKGAGIPGNQHEWYVRRVKEYEKAGKKVPLNSHGATDVKVYLNEIGRKSGLKDWQIVQIIHALEILFREVVGAEWAATFDWESLKQEAASGDPEVTELKGATGPDGPWRDTIAGQAYAGKPEDVIEKVRHEVRKRHYSIRTEETYVTWVRRYLNFCGKKAIEETHGGDVLSYLEYLAILKPGSLRYASEKGEWTVTSPYLSGMWSS
jgi:hypothetical protein